MLMNREEESPAKGKTCGSLKGREGMPCSLVIPSVMMSVILQQEESILMLS